jgi:signal transduction histidine kinase
MGSRAKSWVPEVHSAEKDVPFRALPSALAQAVSAALRRAAREPGLSANGVDVCHALTVLSAAIAGDSSDPPAAGATAAVYRRLLELLRTELLGIAPPESDAAELIRLLRGIERLSGSLASSEAAGAAPLPTGLEFVAGVAHDLRSPLTSILFLAETLHAEQSGEINEIQRRQLGIIYSAALGLVAVASDIIELARGGEGLTERRPTLFSVTEILESVHDIVRPMAEEKGLRVQLFPPAVDQRLGYPLALSRVLLNLTTNGLKFTDTGFVEISCRATSPTRVEFSVRDTGKGYTPDAIDHLYQPFRRSRDGKKYGFSGTGLGLAISQKLVVAMDSVLEVETRPRWGTRFFFELDLPPEPRD